MSHQYLGNLKTTELSGQPQVRQSRHQQMYDVAIQKALERSVSRDTVEGLAYETESLQNTSSHRITGEFRNHQNRIEKRMADSIAFSNANNES